jgi:hypothetical protein
LCARREERGQSQVNKLEGWVKMSRYEAPGLVDLESPEGLMDKDKDQNSVGRPTRNRHLNAFEGILSHSYSFRLAAVSIKAERLAGKRKRPFSVTSIPQ